MKTYDVDVVIQVKVTVDETKFTEEFMREFRENFYPFHSIEEHVEHIAQLEVRDLLWDFTEGYGEIRDMGIDADVIDLTVELPVEEDERKAYALTS